MLQKHGTVIDEALSLHVVEEIFEKIREKYKK